MSELRSLVDANHVEFSGNPSSAGRDTWELRGYWYTSEESSLRGVYWTCVADADGATVSTDTTGDGPPPPVAVEPEPTATHRDFGLVSADDPDPDVTHNDFGLVSADDPDPDVTPNDFGLVSADDPDAACLIKGNVSFKTGELIFHVPGQAYYDETVINEAYGERWFCTEAEAVAAGWRKARM
ncbi:hypothetical protein CCO02nite_16930 [Cellulomonas composti]|uniref:Uncharacterized protein n=1 Tax=Cellulomonas composti TaxID=266130 RepID=A0A511JAL2_9CELL|nr:hypothetical protein CCO02nite_16930 [Cellulomonas composti]